MADTVDFISRDTAAIDRQVKAEYEQATGKVLQPAQPDTLLLNGQTYRESILRSQFNDACNQNFVRNSRGAILDYQAERLGVKRLPAQRATVTVRVFVAFPYDPTTNGVIPAGTRFSADDGSVIFETVEDANSETSTINWTTGVVPNGLGYYIFLPCEASEGGVYANGFDVGQINTCLDNSIFGEIPSASINVSNTTITAGGTDEETDDNLRQRVFLAPYSFSVAGPEGAYEFWARSASPNIVDVAITNPEPGTVKLWPLFIPEGQTTPVTTPDEVLDAVEAACSATDRRPVCDLVEVASPTLVDTPISVQITRFIDFDQTTVQAAVNAAIQSFVRGKARRLGEGMTRNQLIGIIMQVAGVYDVTVVTPAASITVGPTEVLTTGSITVTVTGSYNPAA